MNSLKLIMVKDKEKRRKQIQALEYQIKHDTNEKDKLIHQQALIELKESMKERVPHD